MISKTHFRILPSVDPRKDNYAQIAKFYKMYYDDKKIICKKRNENVKHLPSSMKNAQ